MKKITLLFILSLAFSFNSYAQFPESFTSGLPSGWATYIGTNGEGTVENWTHNTSGYMVVGYEAVTNVAEDWLVTPQVAITATNSLLAFDQTDYYAADYSSELTIRVSTGTSQTTHADFTIIDTQDETSVNNGTDAVFSGYTVDLSAYEGQSIYIAFVWAQNNGDILFIDNVDLQNQYATAPDAVTTPTPADMATNVAIDEANNNAIALAWTNATTGDAPTSYDVYWGTDAADLELLGNTPNTSVNITNGTAPYSTLYYWKIIAKNAGGDAVNSSTWSFTTEADPTMSVDQFDTNSISHFYSSTNDRLELKSSTSAFTNVELYDILGKAVLTKSLNNTEESVDLSSLNSGVYIAKIAIKDAFKTVKFVKN